MKSIQKTLVWNTTVVISVLLLVVGGVIYFSLRHRMVQRFDSSLQVVFDTALASGDLYDLIIGDTEFQERQDSVWHFEELMTLSSDFEENQRMYATVWASDESIVYRSAEHDEQRSPSRLRWGDENVFTWGRLSNGMIVRSAEGVISFADEPDRNPRKSVDCNMLLSANAHKLVDDLQFLRITLISLGLLTVTTMALMIRFFTFRGAASVVKLASCLDTIDERNLSVRLSEKVIVEHLPIVRKVNFLLNRVEQAFRRERTATDKVAHELRTPLAVLRLKLDLANAQDRSAEEYERVILECQKICDELKRVIDDLLQFARLQSHIGQSKTRNVDPNEILKRKWEEIEPTFSKALTIHWNLLGNPGFLTYPLFFERIAANLLENSAMYCDEGGEISISTTTDGSNWILEIVNSGSLLTQAEADKARQSYWRGSEIKNAFPNRIGLGLSLVSEIVAQLNGELTIQSEYQGKFSVQVLLPDLESACWE